MSYLDQATQDLLRTYLLSRVAPVDTSMSTQDLLRQYLLAQLSGGGGGGGGGMVPAGSTGIVAPITTNGTSGPATYNAVTGALNIPNYATGGGTPFYQVFYAMPTAFTTSATTISSSGFGTAYVAPSPNALVTCILNSSTGTAYAAIARTTDPIPTQGSAIVGTQLLFLGNATVNANQYLSGAFVDAGLTVGTTYHYYICGRAVSGSVTFAANTTWVQITAM